LHAAVNVGPGARLSIEFADGRVGVTADTDLPAVAREAKPTATAAKKPVTKIDQGSLF
jgi:exodeoxyribonuclease VII large subunit